MKSDSAYTCEIHGGQGSYGFSATGKDSVYYRYFFFMAYGMAYPIGEFSRRCGINATTLRAWQRRYGLLTPRRTEGGHRLYSDDDVEQALKILDWIKKGVPVSQVKPLLNRPEHDQSNNWQHLQETMLQRLKEGKTEALRQLIYDTGREYPRNELVSAVLRPLRRKISARVPAMMTLREILDGMIISYTAFCMEKDRKVGGENYVISGWQLQDPCEVWLEALKRTGGGCRFDVLPLPPDRLAPEVLTGRKWLLVTGGELSPAMTGRVADWQQQGLWIDVIRL